MKIIYVPGFILFLLLPLFGKGQTLIKPQYGGGEPEVVEHYATTTLDDGEVVPWFPIPEVVVTGKRIWSSEDAKKEYLRLRRNVLRVLPYAIYAQKRYDQLDRDLALVNDKKEQKRLIKACEEEIKEKFTKEIKNLSVSQGKILIKLVDRQTGKTSYDMVREMKGGLTAFFYQGIAKVFGHNLKSTYDSQEDFEIENIIRSFERTRPVASPPLQ
ncbi:DUF4294 domain-containing protein [Sphingobacterium spiritivorum]|uniref:DUF4294 domain-containing protein n=1 Tax=Sphingobacterium spiritivorum TaxID=258 RepID=UPI003DA58859